MSDVESMERNTAYDIRAIALQSLLWWTCDSDNAAAALSRTGLITVLVNLLRVCIQFNIVGKVCVRMTVDHFYVNNLFLQLVLSYSVNCSTYFYSEHVNKNP